MLSASIWDTVIWGMATSASKSTTARDTVATVAAALEVGRSQAHAEEHPLDRVESRRDICRPREVTDHDVGAERAQGIGAVVVVVRHRSHGQPALTQQRHNLAAHAADSPAAGTGHQDETRLSHRPPPFVSRQAALPGPFPVSR
jgi:hypothetical protein